MIITYDAPSLISGRKDWEMLHTFLASDCLFPKTQPSKIISYTTIRAGYAFVCLRCKHVEDLDAGREFPHGKTWVCPECMLSYAVWGNAVYIKL